MSDLATHRAVDRRRTNVDARVPDWRDATGYPAATAPLTAFAWQFVRRSAEYGRAWNHLPLDRLAAEFGLHERVDPDCDEAPSAAWHDGWDPAPALLQALAFEGALEGARVRVLDELRRQARAAEFDRLSARLGPLRVRGRDRYVAMLRAFDGHTARESDVEIAAVLFPEFDDARRYPYSASRTRARHAWQEGTRFVAGRRYRLLALAT